jgi:Fe-S oxidoreductase/nitrate reductase gamma subunit
MMSPELMLFHRDLGVYSDQYLLMYAAAAGVLAIFLWGMVSRIGLWRLGKGRFRDRMDQAGVRIGRLLKGGFGQTAVLRDRLPGWAHITVLAGFIFFTIGTVTIAVDEHLGIPLFRGWIYLAESFLMDLMAFLSLAAVAVLLWRRTVQNPDGLGRGRGDLAVLSLLGFILGSGLVLEGVRMAIKPDPAPFFSPGGAILSGLFADLDTSVLSGIHASIWWLHLASAFVLIAVVPWTRMIHVLAAPLNIYFARLDDDGSLVTIDFDTDGPFGTMSIEELHKKQLLELDACMECGRCQRACPAHLSGKSLSPEKIGTDLRSALLAAGKNPGNPVNLVAAADGDDEGFVLEDSLWSCTTCRACEIQCPVNVEHVRRIIDMRRAMVMMESRFPEDVKLAFRNLETSENPWNFPPAQRLEWINGLDIPLAEDGGDPITILWAGCVMSLDQDSKQAVRAVAASLKNAGVDFQVLGTQEACCGDPARRLGNEYLFQEIAKKNVEIMKRKRIERIITPCPHCYHTLLNEYSEFGLQAEVVHHSQLIEGRVTGGTGKLLKKHRPEKGRITFHDPCYLARYGMGTEHIRHLVYDEAGDSFTDLPRREDKTFCCGSGGGRFWMDDKPETRINAQRCREIIEAGVETVVTACPYCRIMLRNGLIEECGDTIRVLDLAEFLDDSKMAVHNNGE